MQDVADAIQDAEYIGAMCNPAPMPTVPLDLISNEDATAFAQKMRTTNPEALTFETILAESLGYYLFKQHLESLECGQLLAFVEAALEYSAVATPEIRLVKAQQIVRRFFPQVFESAVPRVDPRAAAVGRSTTSVSHDYGDSFSVRSTGVDTTTIPVLGGTEPLPTSPSLPAVPIPPAIGVVTSPGVSPRLSRGLGSPDTGREKSPKPVRRGLSSKLAAFASQSSPGRGSRRVLPQASADGSMKLPDDTVGGSVTDATGVTGTVTNTVVATEADSPWSRAPLSVPSDIASAAADPIAPLRHALRFRNGDHVRGVIIARQKSMTVRARAAALFSRYKSQPSPIGVDGDIVEVARQTVASCRRGPVALRTLSSLPPYDTGLDSLRPMTSGTASVSSHGYKAAASGKQSPPRSTSLAAASPAATGVLPPTLFDELTDAVIEGCRARFWSTFLDSPLFMQYLKFKHLELKPVSVPDFVQFRILGRGGFGSVNGCRKRNTGKLYAMKVMNKRRIKMKNASDLCWNERVVLSQVNSPFVVSLKYAFQTQEELYLILDMMPGGDLAYHLGKCVRFSEAQARFYAAEILLGLEHLHGLNIVYRDLKPENILLDMEGHCRITDMGLATHVTHRLAGRCGTRGYWAPEMLIKVDGKRQTYGFSVDWWSFGCLLYEFLFGKCPFRTDAARSLDPDKHKSMDKATLHLEVMFPERYFSPDARSLIQGLLTRDPLLRLGSGGASEVKAHPFFSTVDWGMLETGQVTPPFYPEQSINAASQDAIGAFESIRRVALEPEDLTKFDGWVTVNKQAFQAEVIEYLAWEKATGPIRYQKPLAACCAHQ